MNQEEIEEIKIALEFCNGQPKTRFHLRRLLGEETKFIEINGHLFYPNPEHRGKLGAWCQVKGCELSDREIAEKHECPTPAEAIHQPYNNSRF